ncbi:hypothetical protein BAUCODRAFT_288631 [Baudoinia panamericana UAMH 10762]|uniref:C3H1-type domain-containing protein n=1 Tax=Baudoinia panamericana (strain UAMH 10762) TaxID=717646 RepID=M2MM21_BAUPA|nr:uncharacterized protein BAUCODRAFT_288631 [Baudoinia panamericana UAMH 10762]EMC92423.1 hypothetical protein BAUCODRAFT_288631 [Baudoinia panamericana UAMH 10762]
MSGVNTRTAHFSASQEPSRMAPQRKQARLTYFISRDNGTTVPLIPADELPFNIRLQGVPRILRFEETVGMQHVGFAPHTGSTYVLEREIHLGAPGPGAMTGTSSRPRSSSSLYGQDHVRPKYLAPDAYARQALAEAVNTATFQAATPQRQLSAHETATNWRNASNPPAAKEPLDTALPTSRTVPGDRTQSVIDAILATTTGAASAARLGYTQHLTPTPTPPSGFLPDQDRKEYCTYWIRHGECDFMQQGCMFKHEMPDKATLERIGIRCVPRWWAEKQSVLKRGVIGGTGKDFQSTGGFGALVKGSAWLKRDVKENDKVENRSASGEATARVSDSDSDSSAADSVITGGNKATLSAARKFSIAQKPAITRKAADVSEAASTKPADIEANKRTSSPPATNMRKASTCSDLIDLAVPLLPTPASTTPSTPSEQSLASFPLASKQNAGETLTSTATGPNDGSKGDRKCSTARRNEDTVTDTTSKARVFVPKGESPESHIPEARKREYARSGAISHSRKGATATYGEHARVEGIQATDSKLSAAIVMDEGLMASRHAPRAGDNVINGKRSMRASDRPRRPAVTSKAVVAKA